MLSKGGGTRGNHGFPREREPKASAGLMRRWAHEPGEGCGEPGGSPRSRKEGARGGTMGFPASASRRRALGSLAEDGQRRVHRGVRYPRGRSRRLATLLLQAGLDAESFAPRYLCLSAAVAEALPGNAMSQIAAKPDEENLFRLL